MGVYALRCPMCVSHRLVLALWQKGGVRTFTTDLDREEWLYYRNAPPIDVDDVIRVARLMSGYDGDLSEVLEDPLLGENES